MTTERNYVTILLIETIERSVRSDEQKRIHIATRLMKFDQPFSTFATLLVGEFVELKFTQLKVTKFEEYCIRLYYRFYIYCTIGFIFITCDTQNIVIM